MLTIGKTWPRKARGSNQASCDYCGATWIRREMRRDRSGFLACPDDQRGRDFVTLDEGNSAGARRNRRTTVRDPGALQTDTIAGSEKLMVPLQAGVRDPHTNDVIPDAGVEATVDVLWLWLRDTGRVEFQEVA